MNSSDFNKKLKSRIMRRVFRSWLIKSIAPLFVIELFILMVAVYFFGNLIYVSDVIDNMIQASPGNPFYMLNYLWGAFFETRLEVQVVIILLFIGAFFLLKDLNRSFVSYLIMKRDRYLNR